MLETVWRKVKTTQVTPGPRRYHTGCLDSRNQLVIFGGCRPKNIVLRDLWKFKFNDTNNLSSGEWSEINVSGRCPAPRFGHSATMMDDKMYVFGGVGGSDGVTAFEDLWCFDVSLCTWTRLGEGPAPRYHHACYLNAESKTLIVHGGSYTNKLYRHDLWSYSLLDDTWTRLSDGQESTGPGGIAGNMLTRGPLNSLMSCGGYTGDGGFTVVLNVYSFETYTSKWSVCQQYADNCISKDMQPAISRPMVASQDPNSLLTWVFGGCELKAATGTLFVFNPQVHRWLSVDMWMDMDISSMATSSTQSNANPRPVPRYGHCQVLIPTSRDDWSMVVYGGSGSMYLDDLLVIELPTIK